jgi:hypothetical protein
LLDLPETFFDAKVDSHISRLRVRNYPEPLTPPKPGQLRAGAHCDYGSLTILKAEANPGGLQVFNEAGEWVDARFAPAMWANSQGPRASSLTSPHIARRHAMTILTGAPLVHRSLRGQGRGPLFRFHVYPVGRPCDAGPRLAYPRPDAATGDPFLFGLRP